MAYQGRQPGVGVRNRFIYSATGGQTSFSGADSNGLTLAYSDATYVDVFLNGTLLVPVTDYAATTKTSVVLGSGAAASDIVEIVAYDISSMSGAVNKTGDTMTGNLTVQGTVAATAYTGDGSALTGTGSPSIDDNGDATAITIDSSEKVGIGDTSPSARLEIGGMAAGEQALLIQSGRNDALSNGLARINITDVNCPFAGLQVDHAGTGAAIIANGKVGIGTANPTAKLNVAGFTSGDYLAKIESTNQFGLKIKTTSTSDSHEQFAIHDGNNTAQFKVMGGGTVYATGINLGGSAAANRLDDYEEGTFSPIISGGSNAGTVNYNTRIGQYTKVGNLVTVWMNINWSSGNGSGSLMVKGLPFSVINTARPVFNVISENVSLASNQLAAGFSNFSDGIIMVRNITGTGATLTLTYDSAGTLFLTGTYPTTQ